MILRALYDYYKRCDNLPAPGMEEKQIGFILVISKSGKFIRIEDCRIDKDTARTFLVKKSVGRSSAPVANYLYDNSAYVFGYSNKGNGKEDLYFETFKTKAEEIRTIYPDNDDLNALWFFYQQSREQIVEQIKNDPLWEVVEKNLSKKFSFFTFRIEGDTKIIAQKKEILDLDKEKATGGNICLITGCYGHSVETTTATAIAGSQATAKLVSFQVNSGYDSYGKQKGYNAPISEEAEFAYTTALNAMLAKGSHNKFLIGNRSFVFWASSNNEASKQAEESIFDILGFSDGDDDPNSKIEKARAVFKSLYTGQLKSTLDDKFFILGLAPNAARIAVCYWSELPLKEFAKKILQHFEDMEIRDTRKEKKPYMGLKDMLSAVTLGGKVSDATPNLPDAIVKSIFEGLPYPYTLFASCIRRIRAESSQKDNNGRSRNACTIARIAILKAYLNRVKDNHKKIQPMLDKENTNCGYLCGRLFAVLDKIQEDANRINSIRERYMNAASSTPSSVFATILNLSSHHSEKLNEGSRVFYEKLKQEIIDKLSADGFPSHLSLQDQGRFFIGFYHQRQDLFTAKKTIEE